VIWAEPGSANWLFALHLAVLGALAKFRAVFVADDALGAIASERVRSARVGDALAQANLHAPDVDDANGSGLTIAVTGSAAT
jgi:hypothetical protein